MSLLYACFMLSVTFPFVQLVPLESYTQPYALVLGATILLLRHRSTFRAMPFRDRWALTGLALLGLVLFLITCFPYTDAQELKYLLNYLAPFLLTPAVLAALRARPRLCYRIIAVSVTIWVFVASVQTLVDPRFMTPLIGSWSDVAEGVVETGRGVLGLAPEPTHHAFHMLIVGASLMVLRRSAGLATLCIADALLLARSASAVMALGFGTAALVMRKPARLAVCVVLMIVLWYLGSGTAESWAEEVPVIEGGSRILSLLVTFLSNPADFITLDYSVNARIGGAAASFAEIFHSYFLPHGLSHDGWLAMGKELVNRYDWLLDISLVGPPSGIGVVLYQAGFLALPALAIPFMRIVGAPAPRLGSLLIYASVIVFLGQYYISSPDFSLLYGCAIYAHLRQLATRTRAVAVSGDTAPKLVAAPVLPEIASPHATQ